MGDHDLASAGTNATRPPFQSNPHLPVRHARCPPLISKLTGDLPPWPTSIPDADADAAGKTWEISVTRCCRDGRQ